MNLATNLGQFTGCSALQVTTQDKTADGQICDSIVCLTCGHTWKDNGLKRSISHKLPLRTQAAWKAYNEDRAVPAEISGRLHKLQGRSYRIKQCSELFTKEVILRLAGDKESLCQELVHAFGWEGDVAPEMQHSPPKRVKRALGVPSGDPWPEHHLKEVQLLHAVYTAPST